MFDASSSVQAAGDPGTVETFRAIGYRQTLLNAKQGGKANANAFRFRNEGMLALGRTFRGQPFITAHDRGDVRARGGTIVDSWSEKISNGQEWAVFYDIEAVAQWAKEGLANGTIDRFSFSVDPVGGVTCTIHDAPAWSTEECFYSCWPGMEVDGAICEFEFEDGIGLELSAVNVPAVGGTGIVSAERLDVNRARSPRDVQRAIAALCSQPHLANADRDARQLSLAVPRGVYTAPGAPITMAPCSPAAVKEAKPMDPVLLRKSLGLSATATDDEVLAKINANATSAAQSTVLQTQLNDVTAREQARVAELDAAHVESEITRLKATRQVSEQVVTDLRAAATASRATFDSSLALVEKSAPAIAPGPGATRAGLQSDSSAALNPGAAAFELEAEGPDPIEANRTNPNLPRFMKACKVDVADVRKHGSRQFVHVPNLAELVENTTTRGDRPGVGK